MTTPVTDVLRCELPLQLAPMGSVSATPALALAVTRAGAHAVYPGLALPPAATTGTDTAPSTASSSGRSAGPSMRLRPPDSHPLAITTPHPAASAARASSADSTCQPQTPPFSATTATSAGSGSARKKST